MTEVLLNNLERFLVDGVVDIDNVGSRGIVLQRLADEIDCLNKSRTAIFHEERLSVKEIERCCGCVERLWRRFGLEMGGASSLDYLQGMLISLQVA